MPKSRMTGADLKHYRFGLCDSCKARPVELSLSWGQKRWDGRRESAESLLCLRCGDWVADALRLLAWMEGKREPVIPLVPPRGRDAHP